MSRTIDCALFVWATLGNVCVFAGEASSFWESLQSTWPGGSPVPRVLLTDSVGRTELILSDARSDSDFQLEILLADEKRHTGMARVIGVFRRGYPGHVVMKPPRLIQ